MEAESGIAECAACLCLASRQAARAITRGFDGALRPHGIRATQFSMLVVLALAGPMAVGELAAALGVERTTLSRNLMRVEASGWVRSRAVAGDARVRRLEITETGKAALMRALPAWRAAQAEAARAIGAPGVAALRQLATQRLS